MNADFAITTLARYQPRQAVKLRYKAAGRKPTSIRYRELCEDADRRGRAANGCA
jgi:hypothetical protein